MTFNICGCCVSREPIEALLKKRNDVSVNQYVAFINPVALCSNKNTRKLSIDDLGDLQTNNFRKRNLCLDVNGTAFDYLFAKESDYIIIDTWDFRLPMIEKDGCYITIDPTTVKRNNKINEKFGWGEHRHVLYNQISDEQYDMAIDELCRRVLEHYKPEQIILMDSYGVQNYFDEKDKKIYFYIQSDLGALDNLNARAKANYERLHNNIGNCHCIEFPQINKVYGASDARWGKMYLNYWSLYYDYAADAINIAIQEITREEEHKRLTELKKRYEEEAEAKIASAAIVPHGNHENKNLSICEEIAHMTHSEIIKKMLDTRDISDYLDCLQLVKDRLLIVLSTKQTPGDKMPDIVFDKIKALGFTNLTKTPMQMYAGVVFKGEAVCNRSAERANMPVEFKGNVNGIDLSIISRSWNGGLLSSIMINGEEYSFNEACWNIVVFDLLENRVIDSCCYTAYIQSEKVFYHMELTYSDEYYNKHLFIPPKYMNVWISEASKRLYSNRELSSKSIDGAVILPLKYYNNSREAIGGVVDNNFNFVDGETYVKEGYIPDNKEIEYLDETVVYGGIMYNHPGHLLLECVMKKLWWYEKNPKSNYKCAILLKFAYQKKVNFIYEYLNLFGLPSDRIIIVNKPTKFKCVIIPEHAQQMITFGVPYDYTEEARRVIERIKSNLMPKKCKKIFFTKTKAQKKSTIGEEYFIDFFKKQGYEILNPEDLTLREKLEYIVDADEFAGEIGTNTNYALFCKPSVKLTVLLRTNNDPFRAQHFLNQIAELQNVYFVDVSSGFFPKDLVFGLNLSAATEYFKKYAKNVHGVDIDISYKESLKNYLYDYIEYAPQYYSIPQFFNRIKNHKMLTILQNMSEVFLGKEFDTSVLDLTTNEDILNDQVKQLTADLEQSRKRVNELESTDINKAAKLLEATNDRLEKQIAELQNTLSQMQNLQIKIDVLTDKNFELEKSLLQANHIIESQVGEYSRLQEKSIDLSTRLKKELSERAAVIAENSSLKSQVADYEHSRSWRITKPLRSIAWFFRKLLGNTK